MTDIDPKTDFFHRATDSLQYIYKQSSNECICQEILKGKYLWHITFTVSIGPWAKLFSPISSELHDQKLRFAW